MCRRTELSFTVHVTAHHDSGMVDWAVIRTDGDAPAPSAMTGESPSLLDALEASWLDLATTACLSMPWDAWRCVSPATDDQVLGDEAQLTLWGR